MRQRAVEDERADVDAKLRAERRAVQQRLDRLRSGAFGKESLFDDGVRATPGVQVHPSRAKPMAGASTALSGLLP